MTDSYNLSQKKRPNLILIHGLNNNEEAFKPLRQELDQLGWKTFFVTLPCHGDKRYESKDLQRAYQVFEEKMQQLTQEPYVVVAFSHGAVYMQLWLQKNEQNLPLKQILLAPALYIHKQKFIEKLLPILPSGFFVKSFAPKRFRRYQTLSVWEYRILVDGMVTYHRQRSNFKIPTKILIDPKDELVDPVRLQKEVSGDPLTSFKLWERSYLKNTFTAHHILFHPDYYSQEDWEHFLTEIQEFLI